MSFWKWLINRYASKIKSIRFKPKWSLWAYYVGSMGASLFGITGFFMLFVDVEWGLILTGITLVLALLAHYGWYHEVVVV